VEASELNRFKDGDTVNLESLKALGIVPKLAKSAKILKGEVSRKLTVKVAASASAKASVEKAGGTVA
jgi:ribosomal protein L15